jgi:hypothetical protein
MSDLITRLRRQREVCSKRYDDILSEIALAEPDALPALFSRLNEAASICNQVCQLLDYQEHKAKQQAKAS